MQSLPVSDSHDQQVLSWKEYINNDAILSITSRALTFVLLFYNYLYDFSVFFSCNVS